MLFTPRPRAGIFILNYKMPSKKNIDSVADLTQKIKSAKSAALIQYQGLKAAEVVALRDQIKQKGGQLEVTKNSLLSITLNRLGLKLPQALTGPTAVALGIDDEIAPFKEIEKVAKDKDFIQFKYGLYDGKLLLVDEFKKFLALPSKTTLISQFIGGLANPLQRLAYALRFNQTQLVYALKAIADKQK